MSIPFVHLHVHTDYSLLDGSETCAGIAAAAAEFGMPAVACTDHGNMSACYEFYNAVRGKGLKPILGCEFYVAPGSRLVQDNTVDHYQGFHLVCLAENYKGYINLCHLNEEAWLHGFYYKPRIDKEILAKYSEGVITLCACLSGEIPHLLKIGNDNGAQKALGEYLDIFGRDHFFIELQNHQLPEDAIVNPKLMDMARRNDLKMVVTNDSHYLKREHAEAHEVFLCIGTQTNMNDPKRFRFPNDQFYFKSPEEMALLFPDLPEAMSNTVEIAERCDVHLPTVSEDKANHYPEYTVPEDFKGTREDYLKSICEEGMKWRYQIDVHSPNLDDAAKAKIKRMEYELGIIKITGFTSYFLVVWDFLHYAAKIGVPLGPGRGSGAGSLVAYVLGITHIDPLRYNLLFERFLNPDRVSPPDFDIDLCERRRHEVIEYVRDKYGAPNVVQIGTFGTLKAKQVVKDVARALGRSFEEGNRMVKLIPADPKMTLKKALEGDPEHNIPPGDELKALLENEPWAQEIWKYSVVLEGLNRNMSIHAAGVIICDMPVADVCPISKGASDEPTTQYPAVPCEQLGLLKMDFLGLKTLTLIQDALDLIEKNTGRKILSNDIPDNDQKTYDLLNSGNTIAVFQLESPGMQNLCRRFGISRLEDIIALIALFRPGPLQFLDEFLDRKTGKIPVEYDVPAMEPILQETYGIMLYQEQVMQVVQAVAGFSLGNADILRRAMGKKKKDVMLQQFGKFEEGCVKNGISKEVAQNIWDKIVKFAGYGFNKSHSAAYGVLSYRTGWLKANYPAEFMAAVLTSELGNTEKMSFYLKECRSMGISILPPDVNVCDMSFSVDGPNIRFGLAAIKGLGASAVSGILEARKKGGPFKDLPDFCERVEGLSKRLMENLAKSGAFDCFGYHRSQVLAVADDAIAAAVQTQKDRKVGQGSLFDFLAPEEKLATQLPIPDIDEWPLHEMLAYEKDLLGFFVSGHPICRCQQLIDTYQLDDLTDIGQKQVDDTVRVGAYIASVSLKTTQKDNKPWCILNLENRDCTTECLVFSKVYTETLKDYPDIFQPETIVFIEGEIIQRDEGPKKISATRIIPAEKAREIYTQEIHVRLHEEDMDEEKLQGLKMACRKFPGDVLVYFCLMLKDGNLAYVQNDHMNVANTEDFRKEILPFCRNAEEAILEKPSRKRPAPPRHMSWKQRKEQP